MLRRDGAETVVTVVVESGWPIHPACLSSLLSVCFQFLLAQILVACTKGRDVIGPQKQGMVFHWMLGLVCVGFPPRDLLSDMLWPRTELDFGRFAQTGNSFMCFMCVAYIYGLNVILPHVLSNFYEWILLFYFLNQALTGWPRN